MLCSAVRNAPGTEIGDTGQCIWRSGGGAVTSWSRPASPPGRWAARVAWALWGLTLLSLPVGIWLSQLLRRAGLAELSSLQAANVLWILAGVSAATVGAVLASRRPRHPVGWLLLVVGVSEQFTNLVGDYVHYGVMGRPGGLPAAGYLSGFYNSGTVVVVACIGFIALLTPTGSLPSPRWRWWTRSVVAALVVLLGSAALDPHPLVPEDPAFTNPLAAPPALVGLLAVAAVASAATLLVGLLVAAGSLVVRYRRARGGVADRGGRRDQRMVSERGPGCCRHQCGAAAVGDRGGDPALSAVRPGPDHQPHAGLRAADRPARGGLRGRRPRAWSAATRGLEPGGGRGDPGRGRSLPASPPAGPAGCGPALQPAPP